MEHHFQKCMFFSSTLLSRAMTKLAEDAFKPTGLSPTYAYLLAAVRDNPGISQKELGNELYLVPSTITRFIEKLQHKGLVTTRIEGKKSLVHITPEGLKLMPVIEQCWSTMNERISGALGNDNGEQLTSMLYEAGKRLDERL